MVICAIGGDKETAECRTHTQAQKEKNGQKVYNTRVVGITKWK